MSSDDEIDKSLKTEVIFDDLVCRVTISGELDWTKDSGVITKCLEQVWSGQKIAYLELDCRNLFFISYEEVLGTYFLAVIMELKEKARENHVWLLIRLKSKKQAAILSLWGNKMWRRFRRHLVFDDPD